MREVRWQIEEQFCFPPKLGVIKKVRAFSVQPKWQMRTFNQSVQLLGIYHMKASVLFKDGRAEPLGILIEDFDFNDDHAYFEYAFPLKVDLPNGEYRDVSLTILNEKATISSTNNLIVSFEVVCKFNTKKRADVEEQQSPTQVAINEEVLSEVNLGKTVHSHENETTTAQLNNHTATDEKVAVAKLEDASNSIASVQNVESSKAPSEVVAINEPQATEEKVIPTTAEQIETTKPTPPSSEHIASTKPTPPTSKHIETTKPTPPTSKHIETTKPTPPTAKQIETTKPAPPTTKHIETTKPAPAPSTLKTHKAQPIPKQEEPQIVEVSTTNYEQSNSELDFLANLPEDYSELIVQSNKIRP